MAEDSFEKARKAFFGTVTTTPKSSVSPAEFLKPPNKAPQYQSHRSLARQSLASFAESWNRTSMRVSTSTALSIESGCALSCRLGKFSSFPQSPRVQFGRIFLFDRTINSLSFCRVSDLAENRANCGRASFFRLILRSSVPKSAPAAVRQLW